MILEIDWPKNVVCFNAVMVLVSMSDVGKDMYYFHGQVRSGTVFWLAVQIAAFIWAIVVYRLSKKAS